MQPCTSLMPTCRRNRGKDEKLLLDMNGLAKGPRANISFLALFGDSDLEG
jgi:hypothetical protein